MDHGWGAPTSKTFLCLPEVLGLSKMRDTWPWANFLDRVFETEGQSTRQAPGPAHQWTPMELNSTCLWTLRMPSVPCHRATPFLFYHFLCMHTVHTQGQGWLLPFLDVGVQILKAEVTCPGLLGGTHSRQHGNTSFFSQLSNFTRVVPECVNCLWPRMGYFCGR